MDKLIEALQIFLKYGNPRYPTHCEYQALYVLIDPSKISSEDIEKLDKLGFFVSYFTTDNGRGCFCSFRYGSA